MWLSRDPIGYQAGTNLYRGMGNRPMNATDPFGLQEPTVVGFNPDQIMMNTYNIVGPSGNRIPDFDVALPGNPATDVFSKNIMDRFSSLGWGDEFDRRFLGEMMRATDLYPFGSLGTLEIWQAYLRGYITSLDYPLLGGQDMNGYNVALNGRDALTDVTLAITGSVFFGAVGAAGSRAAVGAGGRTFAPGMIRFGVKPGGGLLAHVAWEVGGEAMHAYGRKPLFYLTPTGQRFAGIFRLSLSERLTLQRLSSQGAAEFLSEPGVYSFPLPALNPSLAMTGSGGRCLSCISSAWNAWSRANYHLPNVGLGYGAYRLFLDEGR